MSDYNNTHSNNTNDDLYDYDYITYEETNDDDYIDDDVLDPELDDFDIYRQNHSTNKKSSLNKQKPKLNPFVEEALSIIKLIAVAFIIAFIFTQYIIVNAEVPTGSMKNTIMEGDRLIGFRLSYLFSKPERGDVIIFKYPDDESENFVKRVIGLPGEKVTIKDSKIYINDSKEPLKETYLKEDWYWENGSEESGGELVYQVPEDSYFVLGDNRNNSKDSRLWTTTNYVSKSKIIAKAEFVYWPWKVKGMLETAKYD